MLKFIMVVENYENNEYRSTKIFDRSYSSWKDILEKAMEEIPEGLLKNEKKIIADLDESGKSLFGYYETEDNDGNVLSHKVTVKQIKM